MYLRKIYILLIVAILSINFSALAQAPLVNGEKQLNAGFGLSGWGLPIYGGIDFGVYKDLTVGVEGSFRSYNSRSYNHTIIGILGNCNYHFNSLLFIPNEWDFYAGLSLGFYVWSSPAGYEGPNNSGLGLGLQVGGRYFFNKRFGLNLELAGGNAVAGGKFGITYKF